MDKHDKHHKPGKSRGKTNAPAAEAKIEAPVAIETVKGKGDWPGKVQDNKKSR